MFFSSGNAADKGAIQLDTVFVVDHNANWPNNQQGLPEEFQQDYKNTKSDLWEKHFKYAFLGHHKGIYTYVSKQWFDYKDEYSFLPISENGDRVKFKLNVLPPDLQSIINGKRYKKRPVPLSKEQKTKLLEITLSLTNVQVIGNLTRQYEKINSTDSCKMSCKGNLTSIAKGSKQTC